MYSYINTDSEYYQGLIDSIGKELILEIIINEVPKNFAKYTAQIEQGIREKDYAKIKIAIHTIKSDFRHFIGKDHPIIEFIQEFEDRANEKSEEMKTNGSVAVDIDFTDDLATLIEITTEPLEEILELGEEYKNL
jgi:hypothetical protein